MSEDNEKLLNEILSEIGYKERFSFRARELIDFYLPKIFLFIATFWLLQTLYAFQDGLFAMVTLVPIPTPIYAITSLNLIVFYFINYFFYRVTQQGHVRVTRGIMFTMLGFFFVEFVQSTCLTLINGQTFNPLAFSSFAAVLGCIYIFGKTTFLLKFNKKHIIIASVIYIVSLVLLINSGYFQQLPLYEDGLINNPRNLEWIFNQVASVWIWLSIANK